MCTILYFKILYFDFDTVLDSVVSITLLRMFISLWHTLNDSNLTYSNLKKILI